MDWGIRRLFLSGLMAVLFACIAAVPAAAQAGNPAWAAPGSTCRAVASVTETYREVAADASRWRCGEAEWPASVERAMIRFDRRGMPGEKLTALLSTPSFDAVSARAIGSQGEAETTPLSIEDIARAERVWQSRIDVPEVAGTLQAVVITVDGARLPPRLESLKIVERESVEPIADRTMLIAALLCGLLFAPILFDIGFFRVLRQSFPLYHAAFAMLATVQTFTIGGLLPLFFTVTRRTEILVANMSFDLMTAASALFAASFIEKRKLGKVGRRTFQAIAFLAVGLGLVRIAFFDLAPMLVYHLYYGGYVLFLIGLAVGMSGPLRRGSVATWFLIVSYLPLLAIGAIRIATSLGTGMESTFAVTTLQHLALGWQVMVSAFAVAERFMALKRERDHARLEAELMENISERDALTGLLNRRGMENRFDAMRADGYTTLAIVDLDHFKLVNDRFGHAAGDEVLKVVADTLRGPDEDSRVFRMGGEEFIVLLCGKDAAAVAEQRRRAITKAVHQADIVSARVTASMGLVDAPLDAMPNATFLALYEKADRLLYEAKAAGRDRTISERLQAFRPRRREDRRVAA